MVRERTIYPGDTIWYVLGVMWCPAVAGLATRLIFQRTLRGVGWRWGEWKYQWASYFIPIGRTLLELGARGGLIRPLRENPSDITSLPIDERFFIGGSTTVRSFDERDLGPHDRRVVPSGRAGRRSPARTAARAYADM